MKKNNILKLCTLITLFAQGLLAHQDDYYSSTEVRVHSNDSLLGKRVDNKEVRNYTTINNNYYSDRTPKRDYYDDRVRVRNNPDVSFVLSFGNFPRYYEPYYKPRHHHHYYDEHRFREDRRDRCRR